MNKQEEIKFVDDNTGQLTQNSANSFKEIILRHLERITKISTVEFRGGYWDIKTTITGIEQRIYVEDTREVYSNAVEILADLLTPHFDNEASSEEKEINKEKDGLRLAMLEEKEKTRDENKLTEIIQNYSYNKRILNQKLLRTITKFLSRIKYLEAGALQDD